MKKIVLLHGVLLLGGLVFGAAAYFCLPEGQAQQLQQYLLSQMQSLAATTTLTEAAVRVFRANVLDLARLYLAGICLLGVPLIALFLFLKGFTFGFTACFLLGQWPLLLVTRLLAVPLLLAAAALGCRFSWMLVQNRVSSPLRQLAQYTMGFVVLLLLALLFSAVDGFSNYSYLHKLV